MHLSVQRPMMPWTTWRKSLLTLLLLMVHHPPDTEVRRWFMQDFDATTFSKADMPLEALEEASDCIARMVRALNSRQGTALAKFIWQRCTVASRGPFQNDDEGAEEEAGDVPEGAYMGDENGNSAMDMAEPPRVSGESSGTRDHLHGQDPSISSRHTAGHESSRGRRCSNYVPPCPQMQDILVPHPGIS